MASSNVSTFTKAGLDMRTYLRKVILPNALLAILMFILTSVFLRKYTLPSWARVSVYAISILPLIYAVIYPYARVSSKNVQINSKIPYFATYFAVLSTSDVSRRELVWNIASEETLEPIAGEMRKIYTLIAKFNRGLPTALRFLSKRSPSKVFADFLDRLAYSLDSGVELKDYLLREQQTVMDDYETFYEGALYDLDVFKEIYSSLIIAVVFMVAFIIIGPIITGQSIEILAIFALILVLATEIGVLLVIKYKMPEDMIWAKNAMKGERREKVFRALLISIIGTILTSVVYVMVVRPKFNLPEFLSLAVILTPLAYFGRVLDREENSITIKDENFPAFIRSLSTSLASSGSSITLVLKYLSSHDFGTLTTDIRNLYRRLAVRVSDTRAWNYFISDTGSWLISMFSEIFRKSIRLGADPEYVGLVISRNFERLIRLRRKRVQSVSSFKGVIFGVTGAFAFSLAASFQVVLYINKIFSDIQTQGGFMTNILFMPSETSLTLANYMILLMILIHSLVSAIAIKLSDGGHLGIAIYYFVMLTWISAIGIFLGEYIMSKMIHAGGLIFPIMWGG